MLIDVLELALSCWSILLKGFALQGFNPPCVGVILLLPARRLLVCQLRSTGLFALLCILGLLLNFMSTSTAPLGPCFDKPDVPEAQTALSWV